MSLQYCQAGRFREPQPSVTFWTNSRRPDDSINRCHLRPTIGFIVLAVVAVSAQQAWALANPASVFCVKSGGKSEIRTGPRGQYGVCRLPDGRVVEEWSYFRSMKSKADR